MQENIQQKETLANHKRVHTGEKPYFIYCGETIKIEDFKGRIQKEDSVEDPHSNHQETENSNIYEDIKEEVKEEECVDDPLSIKEGARKSANHNICTEVKEEGIDDD